MTIDELRERIKDEIVLHEGDVAEYQWRQMGLTDEAVAVGLSPADFSRLVNQVSLNVQPDFGRITDLRTRILSLLTQRNGRLTPADLQQIVQDAEPARLTRSFVVDVWVPALQKQVPATNTVSEPPRPEPVTPAAEPVPPLAETTETVRRKVMDVLSDYDGHIPAAAIRSLFRAISYNESDLSVTIWSYLQIHQYVPDREPQGVTLRDKITSTDWRHPVTSPPPEPSKPLVSAPTSAPIPPTVPSESSLVGPPPVVKSFTATPARVRKGDSVTLDWDVENLLAVTIDDLGEGLSPKNRGWIKPSKTADYTLFDANDNPLSVVRVEVIQPDRSGLYGVLFALALLGLIYWFVKSNNATPTSIPDRKPDRRTERTTRQTASKARHKKQREPTEDIATDPSPSVPKKTIDVPIVSVPTKPEKSEKPVDKPLITQSKPVEQTPAETVSKPSTPADARTGKYEESFGDKPYDKVELGADERGWRRARSKGRWGYINEADEWVIQPEYEAVTPFRGNTAAVFLNGQLMTINREGQQVRK